MFISSMHLHQLYAVPLKEVHGTFGAYDITAKLEAETAEKLRETITQNLRKMDKIRSTLTLTVVEGQG